MSLISLTIALVWLLSNRCRQMARRGRRDVACEPATPSSARASTAPLPVRPATRPRLISVLPKREQSAEARVAASISRLREESPEMSAASTLTRRQQLVLLVLAGSVLLSLGAAPLFTLQAIVALVTLVYLMEFVYRVILFRSALRTPVAVVVTDEEARALADWQLPTYTVLAAAYREPEVVERLLKALDGLEYPKDKLDVKLLLEADDELTIAAVRSVEASHIDVVLVPPAEPRTKPKALNYGLMLARGELVTVYDAEDRPEPLQLRRAVAAFRRSDPDVVCLQAKLSFYNARQNLITRWFTAEYAMWFSFFLPGLIAMGAPVPLGGTSNHFVRRRLEEVGAWDPFNVTEDADLGVRLARRGWKVGLLESTTYEEANSDFINWVKQRSRWYKGYLQTWFVHMRHPVRMRRDVGRRGITGFCLFVGGTPTLALLNPILWVMALLWFTVQPQLVKDLFPGWVYHTSLITWIGGNFAIVYTTMMSARATGKDYLVPCALLSPLYWLMMSVAAVKALVQLVVAPSFWEKTTHGLGDEVSPAGERLAS